jgi:hypothetical protein
LERHVEADFASPDWQPAVFALQAFRNISAASDAGKVLAMKLDLMQLCSLRPQSSATCSALAAG